jgi:hypothetical protein
MNCAFAPTGEIHKRSGRQILRCQRPGCKVFGLMPPSGDPANLINTMGCEAFAPGPCDHLGAEVRREDCTGCKGKRTQIKIFDCAVHGECSIGKKLDGVACCAGCKDFATTPPRNPS